MNTESSIKALEMAVKQRKNKGLPLIHHSDRRVQYYANDYQDLLTKNGILHSMTQNSYPYENAVAERTNGILKQEFIIDKHDHKLDVIKSLAKKAIDLYNGIRSHYSNYMLIPDEIHK
jgi:putative transposase